MNLMAASRSQSQPSFPSAEHLRGGQQGEPVRGARYERLEPIATGGMGKVYLGRVRSETGTRTAAIKVMHPQLVQEADMVAMFLDEARISMRLRHPNIVEVWDMDLVGDELVIVMEYVEGTSFSHIIRGARRESDQVSIGVTVRILLDTLAGLHAAHELTDEHGKPMGLVHRDVSPQNLLVGADGITRLVDFGVALSAGRIASTAPDGAIKGKLSYLAPEQLTRRTLDRRLDIFAAGIVLWEALTGARLFNAPTEAETVTQVLREPISPPSFLRPEVTSALDEVCLKALERDPARRYATAADFAAALRAAAPTIAQPEEVGHAVLSVAGDAITRRRDALERPETTVLTDGNAALDVSHAPVRSGRRMVAVALLSVIGGVAVTAFVLAPHHPTVVASPGPPLSVSTPQVNVAPLPLPVAPPTGTPPLPAVAASAPAPSAPSASAPRPPQPGPRWPRNTGGTPRPTGGGTFTPSDL